MVLKISDGVVFTEVIDSNTKIESTVIDSQIRLTVIVGDRQVRLTSPLDDTSKMGDDLKKLLQFNNHYSDNIYLQYISPINAVIDRIMASDTYQWSLDKSIRLDISNDRLIRELLLEVDAMGDTSKNIKYVRNYFKFYSHRMFTNREKLNELELITNELFWPSHLLDKSVIKVFKRLRLQNLVVISTILSHEQRLSDFYKCELILTILRDLRSLKSERFNKYVTGNPELMKLLRGSVRDILLSKGLYGFIESISPTLK